MMDNSAINSNNPFVLMTNNDSNAVDNSRAQVADNNRIQVADNITGNLNNHILPPDTSTEAGPPVSMRRCEKAVLQFPHSQMSDDQKNQEIARLLAQNAKLEQKQAQLEQEIQDLMTQLGEVEVNVACEQKKAIDRQHRLELFGPSRQRNAACQTVTTDFPPLPSAAPPPPAAEAAAPPEPIQFPTPESGEQNGNDGLLHNITKLSDHGAEGTVRINYNLLLLSLSNSLLSEDTAALREWAQNSWPDAGISNTMTPHTTLLKLSEKGAISPANLGPLGTFMSDRVRFDCVHVIDRFVAGDYDFLHQNRQPRRSQDQAARSYHQHQRQYLEQSLRQLRESSSGLRLSAVTRTSAPKPAVTIVEPEPSPAGTGPVRERDSNSNLSPAKWNMQVRKKPVCEENSSGITPPRTGSSASGNAETRPQPQRPAPPNQNSGVGEWLCSHYKRRAYVTFGCCSYEKWWPCHRCHNNLSSCGRRKLKSRDATQVKCARVGCEKEQDFAQYCTGCSTKFADYFCLPCQHLTGHDDTPYHCEKCGICRVHGDRSFHCDVCGVCLDVQLRDNHKCRAGSAHDECCICLEDAFTGCQILPCSHKVHRECATQMIRSGITRCPICRESFAHKLERHPISKSKLEKPNKNY